MKAFITILKIYMWILIAWAVMSWLVFIPGAAELRALLDYIVVPVVAPFSFLNAGGFSIAVMVPYFLLYWLVGYLENNYATSGNVHPQFEDDTPTSDRNSDDI